MKGDEPDNLVTNEKVVQHEEEDDLKYHRKPVQFRDAMLNVEGIDRGMGKNELRPSTVYSQKGDIGQSLVDEPFFV